MIELRDYQRKALDELYSWFGEHQGNPCIEAPTGCHAKGTGILMADGSIKNVEDIRVGDRVMGGDGTGRNVLRLHRGTDEMFKISPIKGDPFIVNGGHILSLIATNQGNRYPGHLKGTEICNISVYDYLSKSNNFKHVHKLYRGKVEAFETEQKDLAIPPYVIGLLLGDGNFSQNALTYTNPDKETYAELYEWANSINCELSLSSNSTGCPTLKFKGKERFRKGKTTYGAVLRKYDLKGHTAENKSVPKDYLYSSWNDRKDLLAGLLDTDGHMERNCYDYISKSRQLATDVCFLARSLGLRALLSPCEKSCQTGSVGEYFRVSISGETDMIPCRIKRKQAQPRQQKKRCNVTGFSVEPVGTDDYYGFECDGDHLYMMEDFTVTHNSGKSYLIAAFCEENLKANPDIRIVMATHTKELIEQDANALLRIWPEAPVGIYSAGLKRKDMGMPITVGGIQSMYRKASEFGHVDVLLVDEAHMIPVDGTGMYLTFIRGLKETNPELTVIGFTATPYRLKHGMITDKPAIFDAPLIKTIGIRELQERGVLSPLRSKATKEELLKLAEHVRIQGGDYVESDLQKAIDKDLTSRAVVEETLRRTEGRRHILFFCCGVDHATHVRDILREHGESAETVSSRCSTEERDDIISRFKSGEVRFLTNTSILTTGFDYPDIDCIVMMRPTLSPGLYMQEVGRGLRPKTMSGDCLILDFAGNIRTHGPVADVRPPDNRRSKRKGVAPSKICPQCDEIVAIQSRVCPCCGYEWPVRERGDDYHLYDDDINGRLRPTMPVGFWRWTLCKSRAGEDMVRTTYQRSLTDTREVNEYFLLWRTDIVGIRAQRLFLDIVRRAGLEPAEFDTIDDLLAAMNGKGRKPLAIEYRYNGKYANVTDRIWETGNV